MPKKIPSIAFHTLGRSASTYVFNKLRISTTSWYNEPYHPTLVNITKKDILTQTATHSGLGHPGTDPYFLEYLPLLLPQGGIKGYKRHFAGLGHFPTGPLPQDERDYLLLLETHARAIGKRPVYGFVRSLSRLGHIRQIIHGTHVVQFRNPHQIFGSMQQLGWLNYWSQFFRKIRHGSLADRLGFRMPVETHNRITACNHETTELLPFFFDYYVIDTVAGAFYADMLLNVDLLANDIGYRNNFINDFLEQTNLKLNFDDAKLPLAEKGTVYNPSYFESSIDKYVGSKDKLIHFKQILESISGSKTCKSVKEIQEMIESWRIHYPNSSEKKYLIRCIQTMEDLYDKQGITSEILRQENAVLQNESNGINVETSRSLWDKISHWTHSTAKRHFLAPIRKIIAKLGFRHQR